MTKDTKTQHILISDKETGLPYSKGLMASQVMVTGLSPWRSYQVAEAIEERLRELGSPSVTSEELDRMAVSVIEDLAGERYAKNYIRWREVDALDIPLIVLIGGATGVGKSTIATQLATRLGIVRVVATDAVREVMRGVFSKELMPALYKSSFEAGDALREPPTKDAVVVGFREQVSAVSVGVDALLERAAVEGMSMIIEGAHVVPGFVDLDSRAGRVMAVPVIVTVDDEAMHRSHFLARSADHAGRPATNHMEGFNKIRRVQRYIKSQALSHGVPVIPNYNFDQALAAVIELVMERVTERISGTAPRDGELARPALGKGGAHEAIS